MSTQAVEPQGAPSQEQVAAPSTPTAPEATPASQEQQAPAAPEGETPEQKAARLERELAETRREAASHRTKLREAEGERDELRKAQESEQERKDREAQEANARAAAAEAELRQANLRAEVATLAVPSALNIVDVDTALAMVTPHVEYEGTKPKDVKKALEKLIEAKPFLVGTTQQQPPGHREGEPPAAREKGQLTDEQIDKLPAHMRAQARLERGYGGGTT